MSYLGFIAGHSRKQVTAVDTTKIKIAISYILEIVFFEAKVKILSDWLSDFHQNWVAFVGGVSGSQLKIYCIVH